MSSSEKDIWLDNCRILKSEHCDARTEPYLDRSNIDLLVIHNISLPPAKNEADFNNEHVEAFFTGKLDKHVHPYFEQIAQLRVSAHLYIKRTGEIVQFVPLNKRAWHAGVSEFEGRDKCNDFSIGIEMQGTDDLPFTDEQYKSLTEVTRAIMTIFPKIDKTKIVGHQEIAPTRKTDPGPCFDWNRYKTTLTNM